MNIPFYRKFAAAVLFILCCGAIESLAQQADSLHLEPDSAVVPDATAIPAAKRLRPYGRFNYTYIRIAKLFPGNGFGSPAAAGFAGSEHFGDQEAADRPYALGFESGNVRHFMGLRLGTEMLKLAINSGIAVQAYCAGTVQSDNTVISASAVYLVRLSLGPQLTFKPMADIRLGVYYRAGIAAFYSDATHRQTTVLSAGLTRVDEVSAAFLNYAYNGDIGFDCSWHALSLGISYSMLTCRPSSGVLYRLGNDSHNVYSSRMLRNGVQGATVITPIDPAVTFNRLSISVALRFRGRNRQEHSVSSSLERYNPNRIIFSFPGLFLICCPCRAARGSRESAASPLQDSLPWIQTEFV